MKEALIINANHKQISPIGVFVFVFVAFRSSSRVVTAHYFVRLIELINCDTKHTVQWNTFNDTIVVKLTYFSRTIRYCYNELSFDCAKVEVDQLVMSPGSSFERPHELHKNCGRLLSVCDPNADPNNTWYCFNAAPTSCHRDRRTTSFISVVIIKMANMDLETKHLSNRW